MKTVSSTVIAADELYPELGLTAAPETVMAVPRGTPPAYSAVSRKPVSGLPQRSGLKRKGSALRSCQASSLPRTRFRAALTSR